MKFKTKLTCIVVALISQTCLAQRPTGTLVLGTPNLTNCPQGFSCRNATVTCPDVIEARPTPLILARKLANNPIGTFFIIGGHDGSNWWDSGETLALAFMQRLVNAGYDVAEVRFVGNGWPQSVDYQQGFVRLAARPATVIKWVHDNWHRSGRFQIAGSSEGSAAIGYSVAAYGVAGFSDKVFFISGPPMAALVLACTSTDPKWSLVSPGETGLVDQPWGFHNRTGPCVNHSHDSFWIDQWNHNSVDTAQWQGGIGDYFYQNASVHFIVGARDAPEITNRATRLFNVYQASGQPNLTYSSIVGMQHSIQRSQAGLDELFLEVTQ